MASKVPTKRDAAIGVDLGGTTVKAGVVSRDGKIVYEAKLPANAEQGPEAVRRYIEECKALGFDIIEISSGFISSFLVQESMMCFHTSNFPSCTSSTSFGNCNWPMPGIISINFCIEPIPFKAFICS